jgi:hypothetical protein
MREIPIFPHSRITTVHLDTTHSDEDVIIGSSFLQDSFIKSNRAGLEAIDLLNQGHSLGETEDILSLKYQQKVSIKELILALHEANLISSIDDQQLNVACKTKEQPQLKWRRVARAAFSKWAYWIYVLMFASAVAMNVHRSINLPSLLDSVSVFSMKHPVLVILLGWILVLKHECFHYLAALSLGVPAQIKIGSRYVFIVLETQADAVYLVEKRRRYRFYLAGILGDLLTVLVLFHLRNLLGLLDIRLSQPLIDICILQTLIGIMFQLDVFFKTDLYFVFAELLAKDNLYANSGVLIKRWFLRMASASRIQVDRIEISFALGRLFNYLLVSIVLILSVYLLVTHQQEFRRVGVETDWIREYINGSVYVVLLVLVKIKNRKGVQKHRVLFRGGAMEK